MVVKNVHASHMQIEHICDAVVESTHDEDSNRHHGIDWIAVCELPGFDSHKHKQATHDAINEIDGKAVSKSNCHDF